MQMQISHEPYTFEQGLVESFLLDVTKNLPHYSYCEMTFRHEGFNREKAYHRMVRESFKDGWQIHRTLNWHDYTSILAYRLESNGDGKSRKYEEVINIILGHHQIQYR